MNNQTKETVKDNVKYLKNFVNPIFEQLTLQILVNKPDNLVNFMIGWLLENADGYNTTVVQQLMKGDMLQPQQQGVTYVEPSRQSVRFQQVTQARASARASTRMTQVARLSVKEQQPAPQVKFADEEKEELDASFHTDTTEGHDEAEAEEMPDFTRAAKQRQSVSAEAYGKINKRTSYKPKVVPKNKKQKDRIRERLDRTFMFSALDDKDKEIVIDAMEECNYDAGEYVIRQGEHGNELYVVEFGNLECTRQASENAPSKLLKTYYPGDSFGELALLYNAPRAATIRAKSNCLLYALDRECFNHIVKAAAMKKREHYDTVLQKVSLLQSIDPYERSQIADVLTSVKFNEGDYIIRQGETGDTFYMVEEGTAVATKVGADGSERDVYNYKSGDYFGELALLKDAPRAANVIATSDLNLVMIERDAFKRMFGPLDEILTRNIENYQ